MKHRKIIFWGIFIFCMSLIFVRYKISINDEGYGKAWYFGDAFSSNNVKSAAMYYQEHGFSSNDYLPTYNYQDSIVGNEFIYTHYPPLAEWMGGISTRLTGSHSEYVLSLLPVFLSILLFFLIFKVIEEITGYATESFIAASCLVLSNYFLGWASDFHQHVYIEFGRWLFVWIWWKYLKQQSTSWIIPLLMLIYACICFVSFEAYVYIAIITVGFAWVLTKKIIRWEIALLLLVPVLMFSLRMYINYHHFHDWSTTIADFRHAYATRTGVTEGYSELGRKMTLRDYVYFLPQTRFIRLGHFYLFPSAVLIGLCITGLLKIKSLNKTLFQLCLVVYFSCISWTFLMAQHALIHIFTLRHLAIFVALTLGFGLVSYFEKLKIDFHKKNKSMFVLHVMMIAYSIVYFGINTFYFLYLKYGFMYPHFGTSTFEVTSMFK